MKYVLMQLTWNQEARMFLKRLANNLLNLETKERGSLKEQEKIMLQSRNRERNLHVNILQKKALMKNIVGNYIQK